MRCIEWHDVGHLERLAKLDSSTAGRSLASECAAVTVRGSDSDESYDLLVVELAKFRKSRWANCCLPLTA